MEEGYNINAIEIELNELFKTIPSGSLPILHETLERSIKNCMNLCNWQLLVRSVHPSLLL